MKLTHEDKVLRHLEDYGKINVIEAFGYYDVSALSGVIHRLKEKGYEFKRRSIKIANKYGEVRAIAEYSLIRR